MGPVAVVNASAADPESPDVFACSSHEIKYKRRKLREQSHLISGTIVFAFLQRKLNRNLRSSLIPAIGISYKTLLFQFYDPIYDILIDSELFDLIDENDQFLGIETVLAIWLTMNYELFCTGVTQKMLEADFKADFNSLVPPEILNIYKNELTFGGCDKRSDKRNSVIVNLEEYILESDDDE